MKRTDGFHQATCAIHHRVERVRWVQRGVTNPEWIRVCTIGEAMIFRSNRKRPKLKNQLDLFAK